MADEIDFGGKTLKNATLDSSVSGGGDMRWLGTWNSGTTYSEKDVVVYNDVIYVAVGTGANNTPDSNQSFWAAAGGDMKWAGAWNSSAYYYPKNVVSYNSGLYIASSNHSNQTPYNGSSSWTEILPPAGDMSWAGAWSSGTNYEAKDVVSYDGNLYIASTSSYSQTPYDGSSYWTKMTTFTTTWKGEYSHGAAYYTGDFVVFNNKLYKATDNSLYQVPAEPLYWSEVSPSVGMSWRADWNVFTPYVENDVVIYNSNVYIAKNASGNYSQTPYDGSTYWTLLTVEGSTWKSTWENNKNYSTNDVVLYNGALYAANQGSFSQTPYSGSSYWTSLSGGGSSLPTGSSSSPHMVWNTLNNQWDAGSILPSGSISDGYVLTWDSMLNQWAAEAGGGGLYVAGTGTNSIQPASGSNSASGSSSVVSGGTSNTASSYYSAVSGGKNNTASGSYSAVGGGFVNTASGWYSAISGGKSNTASGKYSTVSGGFVNTASAYYSTVGGGMNNAASGSYSAVGGGGATIAGFGNTASGNYSVISGGYSNTAAGFASAIGGGNGNATGGIYTTVAGGTYNTASGTYSSVLGGVNNNTNNNDNAHIIGSNITADAADTTFVNNLKIVGVSGTGGLTFPDGTTRVTALDDVTATATISAGTLTLDLSAARVFLVNLAADITTITLSNVPATANRATAVSVIFTGDGTTRSVTWPTAVKWPSAVAPTLTSTSGKQSIISLVTHDTGTNWLGFVGGLNY